MADYDEGEITERERLAAERQKEIAGFNAQAVKNQLQRQQDNYTLADKQNARLRDVQLKQNSRKNESDRFEAQRNLQNASIGLLGSMNQAMNGSSTGNLMRMLENRNDADNSTYWEQLQQNQNAVNNAFFESRNQNQVARNDATTNAAKALQDIEGDLAANLSNINPNLYTKPGEGDANFQSHALYNQWFADPSMAELSGYIMPENSVQNVLNRRNRLRGNDYFSRLVNGFNA